MYKKISDSALEAGLKAIEKSFSGKFAENVVQDSEYKAIPTGYDDLDSILTRGDVGGIFLGGICEISGAEGSGKTSLAMRIVGMAQQLGLHCAWIDAEHSFSPDLAKLNRCDISKLVKIQMTTGEGSDVRLLHAAEVLDRVFQTVWSNLFSIVVIDSVAALMPERVTSVDYDANKMGMGELARVMSEHMPKISSACAEKECTVIFINQIREKIGIIYGNPETTPGGRALKFFASQRLSVNKKSGDTGLVKQKDEDGIEQIIGHYAMIRVTKNRRNRPWLDRIEIPIYYEEYFPDTAKKCYDLARKLQVIKPRKDVMTWKHGEIQVVQSDGESDMLEHIRSNKLESYLAYCCVFAAKDEKNLKLKNPVTVPPSMEKLAAGYNPNSEDKQVQKKKIKDVPVQEEI